MVDGSPGSAVMSFHYAGPARGPGYERWIEDLCRRMFQVDFIPPDEYLDTCTLAAVLPDVTLATCTTTPIRVESQKLAGERDDVVFAFASTTRCLIDARSGSVEIGRPSRWLVERQGHGLHVQGHGRVHTLHISRPALLSKAPFAEDLLGRALEDNPAAATLLTNYYEAVLESLGQGLDLQGQ